MSKRSVDVAIIGAGTAGLAAYRGAREYSDNVLLIEGGPYGTTCARVGCMPSKLLIAAAEQAHHASHNGVFGVDYDAPRIDGVAVMDRVKRERDRFAGFVVESVDSFPAEHKLRGYAKFTGTHTLEVALEDGGTQEIEAQRIVIATGSRPHVPALFQAAGDRLVVNDDVFDWNDLPKSVAVIGPGVIGLELGQALSRLGVHIKMFGHGDSVGPLQDPDVRDYARAEFNREFYLDTNAQIEGVENTGSAVELSYINKDGEAVTEEFEYLLAATGRRPNTDKIGLESAQIEVDERGNPIFAHYTMQCTNKDGSASHIFVAGDANNDIPLLHEAADEGKIAGDNAGRSLKAPKDIRAGLRRTPLAAVFTEPQMASVGLNLNQVKQRCNECYAVGEVSFEDQGRSRVMHKNRGLLKVYGEQGTGLLLGAEMFGPAAEHIGHLLSWAVQQRMSVAQILDMPFYHPVIEEGVRTALRDLNHKLHIGPEMIERCLDCGPGA